MSKQISAIQTLAVADSNEAVLSLTLSGGSNVQYLVKALEPQTVNTTKTVEHSKETIQNWQPASLRTAVNVGDAKLTLGIALKISN